MNPTQPHHLTLIRADANQKRLGNHFLKQHKQSLAGKQDELFLLKDAEHKIIGAARLELIEQCFWLRNVFILETLRHQGLGSYILRTMNPVMHQRPTFCFALAHLDTFYQRLDFCPIDPETLPSRLQQKFFNYAEQDKAFLPMQFCPTISASQRLQE